MKADLVRCTTARILPIECQLTGGTMVTSGNAGNGRVQVRLKRINPEPLAQLISNWDDITALLAPTRFAWMLAA